MHSRLIIMCLVSLGLACSSPSSSPSRSGRQAPLFDDLGNQHRWITTSNPLAQSYFDQGLILAYGFNHKEAARSFREATLIDPDCAICFWGVALVLGPNINKPMDDADVETAYTATQTAVGKSASGTPVEQALIQALTRRYAPAPLKDRAPLDLAYANAMREVAERFPEDLDVQTLFAESLMDLMPWDYYKANGQPKARTLEVIRALEFVMSRKPDHAGAIHFYIHAVEASDSPERAEAGADRLRTLVPGAGHLVHMPSHIYLRVGRYADASTASELAANADESYISQCKAQGFYPATYYPHNIHFLWYTSAMEGRSETSIGAANRLYSNLPIDEIDQFVEVEYFVPIPLLGYARFARWDEILAAAPPPESLPYATAMWHYTRGLAHVGRGDLDAAAAELALLDAIVKGDAIQTRERPFILGASNSAVAHSDLAARLELARGNQKAGLKLLRKAVKQEDALPYVEPPYWYYPIRQALGAALLDAGQPAQAEAVYREDLKKHPHNGWSLYGLMKSLEAQGKTQQASDVEQHFAAIWGRADIELTASIAR